MMILKLYFEIFTALLISLVHKGHSRLGHLCLGRGSTSISHFKDSAPHVVLGFRMITKSWSGQGTGKLKDTNFSLKKVHFFSGIYYRVLGLRGSSLTIKQTVRISQNRHHVWWIVTGTKFGGYSDFRLHQSDR